MWKKVYKLIKKYDTIVIARHIGVDPDAMGSQLGLKLAIELTFPEKKVYAIGNGSCKFTYLGKLDKFEEIDKEKALLIVLDTPDKKRIDGAVPSEYKESIKIDHHPFVEEICTLEIIDDTASSTCQLIIDLIYGTKLKNNANQEVMEKLFVGLVSDTNRFIFNSNGDLFSCVGKIVKDYNLDLSKLYQSLYMRCMNEVRLHGYIAQNMIITENGVGYVILTNEIINKFQADSGSAGNMVNDFNYIDEILVWAMISEDKKNDLVKINIRSRGPVINEVAEKYNGGGHKMASGARVTTMEEAKLLINDLDKVCKKYIKEVGYEDN